MSSFLGFQSYKEQHMKFFLFNLEHRGNGNMKMSSLLHAIKRNVIFVDKMYSKCGRQAMDRLQSDQILETINFDLIIFKDMAC